MSDQRAPDAFDIILHKVLQKCFNALDRVSNLTAQDRNHFKEQVEHDLYEGLHIIDLSKPANPTIDNILDNRTQGIQTREQLSRYKEHFNRCMVKLSNSSPTIDFAGLENEDVPDAALAGFTGTTYPDTYNFQGDLDNSGPMSLNWFQLQYNPENTDAVDSLNDEEEYSQSEMLNSRYFLSEKYDQIITKQKEQLIDCSYEWEQRTLTVDDRNYAVFFPMNVVLMHSGVPYEAIQRKGQKTPDQMKGTFDGWDFAGVYVDAYERGKVYFVDKFRLEPKDFHGAIAKELGPKIWQHYTEMGYKEWDGTKGWVFAKGFYCWKTPFDKKLVEIRGFYAGVIVECERFMHENANHFPLYEHTNSVYGILPPSSTSNESQQELIEPMNLSEDQKRYLHEGLLGEYLHSDTTYEQWCNILQGDGSNPVLWVDYYQGQSVRVKTIGYLFYALQKEGYISEEQRDSFINKADQLFKKYDHKSARAITRKSITNQMPPSADDNLFKPMLRIIRAMPK